MDLSLIIPSYNRVDLISQTIQSALNQTQPFAQIIVVDDASTDGTLETLKTFGSRITVIASTKVGVQEARNIGVRAVTTPFVTLCDSDDLLHPSYVETIGNWLNTHHGCDAIYTNHQVFQGELIQNETFSRAPRNFFEDACKDDGFWTQIPDLYVKTATFQPLLVSGVTLKTSFYLEIGGFDRAFNGVPSEDWEFTLRVIRHGEVALCDKPVTLIRRHHGNESRSVLRQRLGEIDVLEHALKQHDCPESYRREFSSIINRHRLWAFEESFGTKKLRLAAAIFPLLAERPHNLKFFVKSLIIQAYTIATNHKPLPSHVQYSEASR